MNAHIKANADLGCDELEELVGRIRNFNYDAATPREHLSLARALKALAADLSERYAALRVQEIELANRVQNLEIATELNEVYSIIAPKKKKGWFR